VSRPLLLIGDDDPDDVFFLRQALAEACPAIDVKDVPDGEVVIQYLRGAGPFSDRAANPLPAYLFLDLKMPRRSGLEVLEWLRAHPETGKFTVVMLSGSHMTADVERARRLGAEYLVKPVEFAALRELMREFCRRAGLSP
jgi:CheY-like chemotaxis protein